MLKTLFVGLVRSNILVDLALDAQEQLLREMQAAAISLTVAGFGAGIFVGGGVALAVAGLTWLNAVGMGIGLVLVVLGALRARIAHKRLMRLKNLLSAKAARDTAVRAATAGVGLVSDGVSAASSFARNLFSRGGQKADLAESEATPHSRP